MIELVDIKRINDNTVIRRYQDDEFDEFILTTQYNNVKVKVRAVRDSRDYYVDITNEIVVREQNDWRLYKALTKRMVNTDRAKRIYEKFIEIFEASE